MNATEQHIATGAIYAMTDPTNTEPSPAGGSPLEPQVRPHRWYLCEKGMGVRSGDEVGLVTFVWPSRFEARFHWPKGSRPAGVKHHYVVLFRKSDGRSIGSKQVRWAAPEAVRPNVRHERTP
jgi:hypothetical protein